MAIDIFTNTNWSESLTPGGTATAQPGFVTIVSDIDDIYLQQVASNPQNLIVANNSGFQDYQSVIDINSYRTIYITNGVTETATNLKPDGYPRSGQNPLDPVLTRHVLSYHAVTQINSAAVSYAGSTWTYNPGPNTFTGPSTPIRPVKVVLPPGQQVNNALDDSFFIEWSAVPVEDAALGITAPMVDSVAYDQFEAGPSITRTEVDRVAAAEPQAVFTLPALKASRTAVIPGSLSGEIAVRGNGNSNIAVPFETIPGSGALLFGPRVAGVARTTAYDFNFTPGVENPDPRRMTGQVDWSTGEITLSFFALTAAGGTVLGPQAIGLVEISEARYAVYTIGTTPTDVTFFPGHDITREVVVDLTASGSAINVDSPIRNSTTTATAVATIGTSGLSKGTVTGIVVAGGGGVYTAPPTVTIAAPNPAVGVVGTTATATATIDSSGTVTSITITNPGSGYDAAPGVTLSAPTSPKLAGADIVLNASTINIDAQIVADDRIGVGPQALNRYFDENATKEGRPFVDLVGKRSTGLLAVTAEAAAIVLTVGGGVDDVVIVPGGGGAGYDPKNPPTVTITAAPGDSGTGASYEAIVAPGGSITGFLMIAAGAGYAKVPTVTVSAPQPPVQAVATATVNADGTIAGFVITDPGGSYAAPPLVTIAPPPPGSGGTQAEAAAVLGPGGTLASIVVTYAGSGYDPLNPPLVLVAKPFSNAVAERVSFNAGVGAKIFELFVDDDLGTSIDRGQIFVSESGSLSGNAAPTSQVVSTPATDLFIQADVSDVICEGTILANNQSYLLRSTAGRNYLAPFTLTTRSPLSGANSGLIAGGTVAVTMANDAPTPNAGATAFNTVEIQTAVDSLRVKAAAALNGAFPYVLSVNERDNIQFDAVAASSNPIDIAARGDITFNATVATDNDLSITATDKFKVSAPMSSTYGRIAVTARDIQASNSLRVLSAPFDDGRDDISLTATGGSIALDGALVAVNNVRLLQQNASAGDGGRIAGRGRIIAKNVSVESKGSVDIRTNADSLSATAVTGFSLSEENDIRIPSLTSGGLVSLTAGGVDPGPGESNAIALAANLYNVENLVTSAPAGSVDVVVNTTKNLVLGDASRLIQGTATPMRAAGSTQIRSFGNIDVLDAPLSGSGARAVRAATSKMLTATYTLGLPGTIPSTLSGPGSINATGAFDGITDLRVGERVLVRFGATTAMPRRSNGVYTVARLGGGVGGNATWLLTRAPDADTGAESPSNTFVQVAEGTIARGKVYRLTYATIPSTIAVRSSSTEIELSPAFVAAHGGKLAKGQLVVGAGIASGATLQAIDLASRVVTLTAGGVAGFGPTEVRFMTAAFGNSPITVAEATLTNDIGSNNSNGLVTFVVSSAGAINSAAGSLGKMIALRNANAPSPGASIPTQAMDFKFSAQLTSPIRLTQQLPVVEKAFVIDGSRRYGLGGGIGKVVVDGSRILQTRSNTAVLASNTVSGFDFNVSGGGAAIRNLVIGGFAQGAAVDVAAGSVLVDSSRLGEGSAGGRLANRLGVKVASAQASGTILNSTIGGSTMAGVQAVNGGSVTIVGSTIGFANNHNEVGVELAGGESRVGVIPVTGINQVATSKGAYVLLRPASVATSSLYLGQTVSGPGIGYGSTIAAIDGDNIVLTKAMIATGTNNVSFGAPKRNSVSYNRVGLVMSGGGNTVTNTDVSYNTYDGVRIAGGVQAVGVSTARSATSNAIFGNGLWGVNIVSPAAVGSQKIIGNFFGAAVGAFSGVGNVSGNVGVNGVAAASNLGYTPIFAANATAGVDANGNQHVKKSTSTAPGADKPWRSR
ncbi:MAG: beta strand repeat-containing protein [Pirellulales bacterium]